MLVLLAEGIKPIAFPLFLSPLIIQPTLYLLYYKFMNYN